MAIPLPRVSAFADVRLSASLPYPIFILHFSELLVPENFQHSPDESSSCDTAYKAIGIISVLGRAAVICMFPALLFVIV